MKTYKETIEKPCLVIQYEEYPESPRQWSNLGYFYTVESRNISPDGKDTDIYRIMYETGQEATSLGEHIKLMKTRINNETDEKVLAIYPVYKYEHSGVIYRRGTAHGFDYSNCGFYIITDKTAKELGVKKECFERFVDNELETYTKWCEGEVYGFTLYNEQGELEDSCWGFYDIEDIRHYLPEEYKNENLMDYLK